MRAEAPLRIKLRPVMAMGGLVFDFAWSSNSYVDSLNGVCSGINTELSGELSPAESRLGRLLMALCASQS